MALPTDLASLMAYIAEHFPFTQEKYPKLDFSTPDRARMSGVEHSLVHITKTGGKLATQVERFHHGGPVSDAELEKEAAKAVVNALNLANALGMSAEQLAEMIPHVMRT